jgi:membrane-associated PAP2 superfamily phosphatase
VIGVLTFSFVKWKWFHDIYEKIEFHIHPDEFQTLCLSNSDYNNLNWIHKHEFVLENIWYDVVKKTWLEDGFCLITVYPDHNEKEFFNFLFKDTNQAPFQESRVL